MNDNKARERQFRRTFADRCSLEGAELEERLDEIDRLAGRALRDRRDEAGTIVLTFERAAAPQVLDLVQRERVCCSHLEFTVNETDDVIRVGIRPRPVAPPTSCGCPMCGG
jgi:hypothetical protein